MDIPQSNYIGKLQELCQLSHINFPEYVDESMGPIFKYKCKLNDWICYGTGTCKKFAKQNAAKKMLDKIEDENLLLSSNTGNSDGSLPVSSVSKLYMFCSKESKETPLFSEQPKNDDLFCFTCSLGEFSVTGQGNSKKEAKEEAAFRVAGHFGVHKWYDDFIKSKQQMRENMSPVQELYMFCHKNNHPVPNYEEEEKKEGNVTHYKITCTVGELNVEGKWMHSKKSAKLDVTALMLQTLKASTPLNSPMNSSVKQDSPVKQDPPVEQDINPDLKRKLSTSEEEPPEKLTRGKLIDFE